MILYVVAAVVTMTLMFVYLLYEQPTRTMTATTTSRTNKPVNISHVMHKIPKDGIFTKVRQRLSVAIWATPIFVAQTCTRATSVADKTGNESTSTQTVPDITTGTSTPRVTKISTSTTTRTTPVTSWTFTNIFSTVTTINTVSMPKPFNRRINEYWVDNESRERGQHRFYLSCLDNYMRMDENDYRRRYGLRVVQGRPWLLQRMDRGPVTLYERGEEEFLFTVILVQSDLDNSTEELRFLRSNPLNLNRSPKFNFHADSTVARLYERIFYMERLIIDDPMSVDAIKRLRDTLSSQDSYNWILLLVIIATMHPYPNDPFVIRSSPGKLSIKRAARMLVGPRGIVHGWAGNIPNIINALQQHGDISSFLWSHECTIDSETDGSSSYDSDSVGYESDSWKSGPRGVAQGRPPVTGMSSLSDTSSGANSDEELVRSMSMMGNPDNADFRLKRFKGYMKRSATERRERRAMRRARRDMRKNYNWERRLKDSAYDMEARRAEILAAEGLRNESRSQELLNAERKTERVLHWCRSQQAVLAGIDGELAPSEQTMDCRLKELRQSLCDQVSQTWKQFYGDQTTAKMTPEEIDEMVFYCWVTPIRWIRQTGPNCGLAVLAMAARPIITCEATMGDVHEGGNNYNEDSDLNEVVEKANIELSEKELRDAESSTSKSNTTNPSEIFVPNIADFQREAIRCGYSGRGEMFSAQAMVNLARMHKAGRYNVTLVKNDLLDMTEESNEEDDTEPELIRLMAEGYEDECIWSPDFYKDFETNEFKQNINTHNMRMSNSGNLNSSSSALTVVERLMRGHLIAVCFDCDRNMMPSTTNGGSTAHWALLCGVIIGKSHKKQKKKIQQYDCEASNSLRYEYEYAYNSSAADHISTCFNDKNIFDIKNYYGREIARSSRKFMRDVYVNGAGIAGEDYYGENQNINEETSSFDISDLDLKRDADRVWVVARHGKVGDRYSVWSLKELAKSNCQLRTPANNILRTIPYEIKMLWNNEQHPIDYTPAESKSIFTAHNSSTNYCDLDSTETDMFQQPESTNVELPDKNKKKSVLEQIQTEKLSLPQSTIQTPPEIQLSPSPELSSLSHPPPPPPPPPPPSSPSTLVVMGIRSLDDDDDEPPFVLPEGPKLNICLAHQFISFEPIRTPNIITDKNDQKTLNPLSTFVCHFSFKMNQNLKKLKKIKKTLSYLPRRHHRRRSDSSSESSTSLDRQSTRSHLRRRRHRLERSSNIEEMQWSPKEYAVQSKPVKQIPCPQINNKWLTEQNQQQPQNAVHSEQIEYVTEPVDPKLFQPLNIPTMSRVSNPVCLVTRRQAFRRTKETKENTRANL
ncbi:uncharacterized protein LOC112596205 [Melanaphis sacchari]|uniref:uncharacterized protein LOC112596205 n=1 Tax=Melanaphis sacchari TaxID=742174 RepID=UPI000DC14E5F|nr:uncharacterized protein LOC112596205 [Melanaphis sacchari]